MIENDDELIRLAAEGLPPLPEPDSSGYVGADGARIWFASFGAGPPVILLHGGMGSSGDFAYQVPALIDAGYRAITIDSRGQGRSTRDTRPFSYVQMAEDTRLVMDHLDIAKAAFVGWSDGADIALVLAKETPERAAGVLFLACNTDPSGAKPFVMTPILERAIGYLVGSYASISPRPDGADKLFEDLGVMQRSQPNYTDADLASVRVPVLSVLGENDEFITREHAEHIGRTIPGAEFVLMPGVSHFAVMQRPEAFNALMLDFVRKVLA